MNMGISRKGNQKKKPYHEAISAVFLPSFFQIQHDCWPQTDDVTYNIQKAGKREIACFNGHA